MNARNLISVAIAAMLIASVGSVAYAVGAILQEADAQTFITLSGTVKNSSGTGISGAKVYIEGYKTSGTIRSSTHVATTDVNGIWSISSVKNTYIYTVHASKFTYDRDEWPNQITTSTSGINLVINPQASKSLDIYMVADEEFRNNYPVWTSTAWSRISSQNQAFWMDNFNIIQNKKFTYSTWNSPNGVTSAESLMTNARTVTGWNSNQQGADVMTILTRQSPLTCAGENPAIGCGDVPGSSGQHPVSITDDAGAPNVTGTVNHELIHNYGFNHISTNYATTMQIGSGLKDYSTLSPPEDVQMAINGSLSKRLWY